MTPPTLTDLPYTIFSEIISYLSATEIVLCRRISHDAYQALTRQDLSISLILAHFPRSLEGRRLRAHLSSQNEAALGQGDWAAVFATLARRYFHLGNADPWRTVKVPVLKDEKLLRGVTPWNRVLSLNGRTAPFHFWDPVWTFAPEEGLLVYPSPFPLQAEDACHDEDLEGFRYRARDLATGTEFPIPMDLRGKVIRRVRISHGLLIFEWCEEEARHPLNESEAAHRHFATAYDVRRTGGDGDDDEEEEAEDDGVIPRIQRDSATPASSWEFRFRSEWKIHYLGMPLSHQDRFFSTHNSTHYVVYIWQPTRSPWGEEEPLERLIIWEIGPPSPYRPSQDALSGFNHGSGPRIIRSMVNGQLREWGIRQSDTPSLRTLALDNNTWDPTAASACGHVFLTEEEHRWSAGPHSSSTPPRLHKVKTTGIPLIGEGPRWVDECGGGSGGGGVGLRFCYRGHWRQHMTEMDCEAATPEEREWSQSETWPGRAPCWRHDDFPYVTVSEVFDSAAGVRIIARDCFMLATLSVHIRPKIRVQGVESNGSKTSSATKRSGDGRSRGSSNSSSNSSISSATGGPITPRSRGRKRGGAKTDGPDGQEVQFADDMWAELMGKGFICGDERWLVGEDKKGDVTILYF